MTAGKEFPAEQTRRRVLLALGAAPLTALAAGAGAGAAATPTRSSVTPASQGAAGTLPRYVRLHWAARGAWVMWVYGGVLLVKPEGQVARPLVRIRGISFSRALPREDGGYDCELDEAGYYCDLASGEPLETLRNPFTDRDLRVVHYRSPQKLRLAGTAFTPAQALPPGIEYRGELTTLAEVGGLVAMTEDLYVRLPATPAQDGRPARPERFSASLATFTAKAAELADPRADWVASTLSYGTMNSFAAWLGMDGVAGVQNMRLAGDKRRSTDLAAVAPDLLARVRRDHPTFLQVPSASAPTIRPRSDRP